MRSRTTPRSRRRIKVRLGSMMLFTADVSPGGFCAEIMRVPRPGEEIVGQLCFPEGELSFKGRIAWAKAGDARLNVRGRFGVTFDEAIPQLDAGRHGQTQKH